MLRNFIHVSSWAEWQLWLWVREYTTDLTDKQLPADLLEVFFANDSPPHIASCKNVVNKADIVTVCSIEWSFDAFKGMATSAIEYSNTGILEHSLQTQGEGDNVIVVFI